MTLRRNILYVALLATLTAPAAARTSAAEVDDVLDRVHIRLAQAERERSAQLDLRIAQIDERTAKAIDKARAAVERSSVHLMLHGLGTREVVKNAPFTADVVYRTEQVLADGNRITRSSESTYARDSEGRTRQQQGARMIRIDDPVAKRSYLLEPDTKLAIALPDIPVPPTPPTPPPSKRAPGAAPPSPPTPPAPPSPPGPEERRVEVRPGRVIVERHAGREPGDVRVEVVRIARNGDPAESVPGSALPPPLSRGDGVLPPLTLHGHPLNLPLAERGKGVTEKLGTRDVEGVRAEGTRTTWTITAGAIGNEKPIVSTSEQWYSPDLQTIVLSRSSDPRTGETTYRLANVRRVEPSPELFRVPADYRER